MRFQIDSCRQPWQLKDWYIYFSPFRDVYAQTPPNMLCRNKQTGCFSINGQNIVGIRGIVLPAACYWVFNEQGVFLIICSILVCLFSFNERGSKISRWYTSSAKICWISFTQNDRHASDRTRRSCHKSGCVIKSFVWELFALTPRENQCIRREIKLFHLCFLTLTPWRNKQIRPVCN